MLKYIATALLCVSLTAGAGAQTLKVKCNSAENLHLVIIGSDDQGHKTSRIIYDVTQGYRKKFSIYKEKYGYDNYNRAKMAHDANDSTNKWTEMHIYDKSNTYFSRLDLTKPADKITIDKTGMWARVRISDERNYTITEVTINDEEL